MVKPTVILQFTVYARTGQMPLPDKRLRTLRSLHVHEVPATRPAGKTATRRAGKLGLRSRLARFRLRRGYGGQVRLRRGYGGVARPGAAPARARDRFADRR